MKKRKHFSLLIACFALLITASGCGGGGGAATPDSASKNNAPKENTDPVTITVQRSAGFAGAFEQVWLDAVKKKYPYITVEIVENGLNDLIVSGAAPDIAVVTQSSMLSYKDYGLAYDVETLTKKYNFDLSKLQQAWVDMFRLNVDGKRELIALPFHTGIVGLYYNKDIFDKFSVPYPKDEMTWDDTVELAKRFTNRAEGGTEYQAIGFADMPTNYLATQLSLPEIDEKTNKVLFANDGWKTAISKAKQLFDVSGQTTKAFRSSKNTFIKNKTLAMLIATNEIRNMGEVNWDVATLPVYKDKPKASRGPTGLGLAITATGEHKDAAFHVAEVMLSKEVQQAIAQDGRPSILTDESLRADFIKSAPTLEGKNVMAFFKHQPAPFAYTSKYNNLSHKELTAAFDEIMSGKSDMNTALREAEERANKAIEEAARP